jgi:RNA polymerase sigma-70 factor, ECF subfamily
MVSNATVFFPDAIPKAADSRASAPACPLVSPTPKCDVSAFDVAVEGLEKEKSDDYLLIRVGRGSKEALSILFRRHARPVFNIAQRILRDSSEAEDLLQELFLFIFQKANLFDPEKSSAQSWIIQMTYHRAIDRRRYLGSRQHYRSEELNDECLQTSRGQVSIDEVMGRALLLKLRQELPAEQRQTLELHFLEGYTFREIAEQTGLTYGNVRNHYYRGLERLRSFVLPRKTPTK